MRTYVLVVLALATGLTALACADETSRSGDDDQSRPEVVDQESTCEGLTAEQCLANERCEPKLGGCDNPPPGDSCSPTFEGCVTKPDPCAGFDAGVCLADPRCEPVLGGCDNPPSGGSCSPTFKGCQTRP